MRIQVFLTTIMLLLSPVHGQAGSPNSTPAIFVVPTWQAGQAAVYNMKIFKNDQMILDGDIRIAITKIPETGKYSLESNYLALNPELRQGTYIDVPQFDARMLLAYLSGLYGAIGVRVKNIVDSEGALPYSLDVTVLDQSEMKTIDQMLLTWKRIAFIGLSTPARSFDGEKFEYEVNGVRKIQIWKSDTVPVTGIVRMESLNIGVPPKPIKGVGSNVKEKLLVVTELKAFSLNGQTTYFPATAPVKLRPINIPSTSKR